MNKILEHRAIFEEGAYRAYVTDEKTGMGPKDIHIMQIY